MDSNRVHKADAASNHCIQIACLEPMARNNFSCEINCSGQMEATQFRLRNHFSKQLCTFSSCFDPFENKNITFPKRSALAFKLSIFVFCSKWRLGMVWLFTEEQAGFRVRRRVVLGTWKTTHFCATKHFMHVVLWKSRIMISLKKSFFRRLCT